jgi:ribosome-associated protein
MRIAELSAKARNRLAARLLPTPQRSVAFLHPAEVMLRIADNVSLEEHDIHERFVRAGGPGGQNMRKEGTGVELRFNIAASSLPEEMKERLEGLAGRAVTTGGVLVVASRAHRSQTENRAAAHLRLMTLLQSAAKPPKKRRPTRIRRSVRLERLKSKKRRAAVKAFRDWRRDQ